MSFCKYSTQMIAGDKTSVDNLFISEFMPYAPDDFVKVYLYGLFKCSNSESIDNSIESFSKVLNMEADKVVTAFYYWQEQGLVKVLETSPVEVRYLPLKNLFTNIKKYKPEKYSAFTSSVQEIITGRMITVNEYAQYYDLIERQKFQPEALLMLIKYCAELKGENVGYNYIVTVARNWAQENITTSETVEERLKIFENLDNTLGALNKVMTIKRALTIEERELYNKWTNDLMFDDEVILFVAKLLKKKKNCSYEILNTKLMKYFEMKLMSSREIEQYEKDLTQMFETAKKINISLGLYYENLEPVIENYTVKWNQLGYNETTLTLIGNFCFKKSIRTLEGMDKIVHKLYKLGLVSEESIINYVDAIYQNDVVIKSILEKLGLNRNVNSWDRNYYQTWFENWNIKNELFEYAVSLAKDKIQPMQYLNKILASYHENKIESIEQAQKTTIPKSEIKPLKSNLGRSYSQTQLNALFDSLEEFEV